MIEVRLEAEEWQRVLAVLAQAPWSSVNQIIMKIGAQMQTQAPRPNGPFEPQEPTQQRQ